MKNYRKQILNQLLDSYEDSVLFTDRNKRSVQISFRFTESTIPEYFDETSVVYDEIHLELEELERRGLIQIHWKNKKAGHIVDKVSLKAESLDGAYAFVSRKKLEEKQAGLTAYIARCGLQNDVLSAFFDWIQWRMKEGLPIRSYVDLDDLCGFDDLVKGVFSVINNREECFIRELSMEIYGDSKKLEGLQHKIVKIIEEFSTEREWLAYEEDIFLACNVVKNPMVLMLKGDVPLRLGGGRVPLGELRYGIGISSKDIGLLGFGGGEAVRDESRIKTILTVENLTTFYTAEKEDALIIYLGGFHNEARRNLIWKAHDAFPEAALLHWGDIDVGGFKIYMDLCRKTGLLFSPWHMDAATLEQYQDYTKPLTAGDRKGLETLRGALPTQPIPDGVKAEIAEVVTWMLEKGRKLEQEIVAKSN